MKRLVTAIALIVVITALCIGVNFLVSHEVGSVRAMVTQCKDYLEKKDSAQAQKTADALVKEWEKRETLLSPFINHEKIDQISLEITSLAANIRAENYPVLLRDAETILTLLHQMEEDEKINIHSIF